MKKLLILIVLIIIAAYAGYNYFYSGNFKTLPAGYYSGSIANSKNQKIYNLLVVSDGQKNTFYLNDANFKLLAQFEVSARQPAEFMLDKELYKLEQSAAEPLRGSASIAENAEAYSWELKDTGPIAGTLEVTDSDLSQHANLIGELKQQQLRLDLISQKIKEQQILNQEMEDLIANPDKLLSLMQQKKAQATSELAVLQQKILDSQKKLTALNTQQSNLVKFSAHGSLVLAAREALTLEGQLYQQVNSRPSFAVPTEAALISDDSESLRRDILAEKDAIYLLRYKLKIPQNEN